MGLSWREVRALNYGTIGRTVHGIARINEDDSAEEFWFDPPSLWRVDRDGTPQWITTPTDEWRQSPDAMVHTALGGHMRVTMIAGAHSKILVDAHTNWPIPTSGGPGFPDMGDPISIESTSVRGRDGWRVEFPQSQYQSPQTFVIDADTGMVIGWSSGEDRVELLSYTLDEVFDPSLFTYTGAVIEDAEESAALQATYDEQQRLLAEIPRPAPAWYPTTVNVTAADGDPATGALDMAINVTGPSVFLRRWLTGTTPPPESPYMSFQSDPLRAVGQVWTYELTSYPPLPHDEGRRIIDSIPPVDPPRPAQQIVNEQRTAQADYEHALSTPGTVETTGIIYTGPVNVSYMQFYLQADNEDASIATGGQRRAFGLVTEAMAGQITLTTGLHTGNVGVTLEIADDLPTPPVDEWEEIGEVSMTVDSPLRLTGWGDAEPGVVLPISRGTYRLRYCANNMDAAQEADTGDLIDEYKITIWPSPIRPDELIKQSSQFANYWNNLDQ